MHDTTRRLLTVLRELQIDGLLQEVYAFATRDDVEGQDDSPPLEAAVYAWAAAGYPDDAQSSPILAEIAAERERQISKGYTPEHDDQHTQGEIGIAGGLVAVGDYDLAGEFSDLGGLWAERILHRHDDERERLIIAAALIVAEIERLDRASTPAAPE